MFVLDDGREELPPAVAVALDLDGLRASRLEGGRVNEVWRTRRGGEEVVVRRSPSYRQLAEVVYEREVLDRLADAGAPVARAVSMPAMVDGRVWAAFEWIDGKPLPRPSQDPYAYGLLLGQIHRACRVVAAGLQQRPFGCRGDEFFEHRRGQSSFAELVEDFAASGGPLAGKLAEVAVAVHERLRMAGCSERDVLAAHGDFGPHQVLARSSGEIVGVVDWDFCRLDLAVADIAIATAPARPTASRVVAMLSGYREAAELNVDDLALLPDLRRAFHLNNLANQVVLWANGIDVTRRLKVIFERLERERWWGPMLLAAAAEVSRGNYSTSSVPLASPEALDDLGVAHELADRARTVALHFFREGVVARAKSDDSPVTEADEAVELLLTAALTELRPDDAVMGEELGGHVGDRTWVLDPIDGTSYFARADPNWRIQIALMEHGEVTVALVDAPALGVRWSAAKGAGAVESRHDGHRTDTSACGVSDTTDLAEARVSVHPVTIAERVRAPVTFIPRTPLPLVELIRGDIDAFYVECCQLWDHAPWILLIEEAGGRFTDHDGGRRPDRRGGLYSNAAIHTELRSAIAESRNPPTAI